jgi:hypothetical protein
MYQTNFRQGQVDDEEEWKMLDSWLPDFTSNLRLLEKKTQRCKTSFYDYS